MDAKTGKIYVVGMGPGCEDMMTARALNAIETADVIVGYTVYVELLSERFADKEKITTPMMQEVDRCKICLERALMGQNVCLICSGDAGVYGMASLMLEVAYAKEESKNVDVIVVPGITAALSGSAVLGAVLGHDFCVISLSDLLTPWELIENRLVNAARGDFAIAIYNPSSKKRADYLKKACDILMNYYEPERPCGYVKNIGREGECYKICTLKELATENVDMFTTVFIGNSQTKILQGRMVTPRGYRQ